MNIDFVILWVDDGDPAWIAEKNKYLGRASGQTDARSERYRDWDNLMYWFRGVEKFAPWVHKIYFVTCGHVPEWLNLKAEKLVHIRHSDYMKPEYLPTFNARPINLNIGFIPGISENIVLFDDDMFLCRPISPEHFFRGGLPVHQARLHAVKPIDDDIQPYIHLHDTILINRHFDFKKSIKENRSKWFSIRSNGIRNVMENIYNSMFGFFPGFDNEHLPVPILKSTIDDVWDQERETLIETSKHRFRDISDINQYIFRYWQLASGHFVPERSQKLGKRFTLGNDNTELFQALDQRKYPMICINDSSVFDDAQLFEKTKDEVRQLLDRILPNKSSYEV